MNNENTEIASSITSASALDSSFRLELVNIPVWWHHDSSPTTRQGKSEIPMQKLPWVAAVIEEIRTTDNILVTEIGERGLIQYLQYGLMTGNSHGDDDGDNDSDDGNDQLMLCDWGLQDEASFRYLMEILQANMIYFLHRRYFDLERCREGCRSSTSSIAQDFQTIFDKASSTKYLANRERIADRCFRKPYQQKGHTQGINPKTILSALVRLHRRAGIYVPHSINGRSYHLAPVDYNDLEQGVDAYWIDLWWVCSSLLTWILAPCLEIARSIETADDYFEQGPSKKRRLHALRNIDATGFHKQRLIKLPFSLIRSHTESLGLYYDKVLLHDGPWDEAEDDDFVLNTTTTIIPSEKDDDDEDEDECTSNDGDDGKDNGVSMEMNVLTEAIELEENGETLTQIQGRGMNSFRKMNPLEHNPKAKQQREPGRLGNENNTRTQKVTPSKQNMDCAEAKDITDSEEAINEVYNSFWANENENLDAVLCSDVVQV